MSAPAQDDYYSEEMSTLGERISVARERMNMSQEELARALAVRQQTVDAWEGDSAEPRANKLAMLAGMLQVSPSWLLSGVGDGVPAPEEAGDDPLDDEGLRERLLSELRSAQEMNMQIQNRISRIIDALSSVR